MNTSPRAPADSAASPRPRPKPPGANHAPSRPASEVEVHAEALLDATGVHDHRDLFRDLVANVIRLARDEPSLGDLKLVSRALREIRVANRVFSDFRHIRKVAVFGSARLGPKSPESAAAESFARAMAGAGFMVITGAGDGIMGAAQRGAGRDRSFGLNIRLPFEQKANDVILKDPKLVQFKYFFTRKLHFVKEAHAVACFPGGFGTLDEAFEALTLLQTGKSRMVPLVCVDRPGGNFWKTFRRYIKEHLLGRGLISEEDLALFKVTDSVRAAQDEILAFYSNFHSYRFVGPDLVIRIQRALPSAALRDINRAFRDILTGGAITPSPALPEERNEPELAHLPRLRLLFNRRNFGRFRALIDRLNAF